LKEGLVHPVIIARTGNWALNHNVVLGPWMHVGSKLQHFAAAHIDDELSVRGRITANYEHKGHRFVDADVLVLAKRITPVARIAHTAIWLPRQLAADRASLRSAKGLRGGSAEVLFEQLQCSH